MEYSPSKAIQAEETMRIGTYTGDGTKDRVIDIGFTPKALWIYPEVINPNSAQAAAITDHYASNMNGAPVEWQQDDEIFQGIIENGFKTGGEVMGKGLNILDTVYFWIASP